jgi:dsRNA-specific ribonuclease
MINDKFVAYCNIDGVHFRSDILQSKKDARNNLSEKCLIFLKETPGVEESIDILEILNNYWCNDNNYLKLLKILGIEKHKNDKKLKFKLMEACTHQSASKFGVLAGVGAGKDYENLEFLGDRILNYVVSEYYFKKYSNSKIDIIQEIYSQKIQNSYIKEVICKLGLDKYLIHDCVKLELSNKIFADQGEAIIAAIYIVLGIEPVKRFIYKYFNLDLVEGRYGKFEEIYKKL